MDFKQCKCISLQFTLLFIPILFITSCYSHYLITKADFEKMQKSSDSKITINTPTNIVLSVEKDQPNNYMLVLSDKNSKENRLVPFTYEIVGTKVVYMETTVLDLESIEKFQAERFSIGKTIVASTFAGIGAMILTIGIPMAFIIFSTSQEDTGFK